MEIVNRFPVETQDDLIDRLMEEDFAVTQATISRDIRELQLTKVLTGKGTYRYVAPKKEDMASGIKFNAALVDSITSVEYAQNLVVIKTISGTRDEMAQKREEYADRLQQLRLDILSLEKDVDTRKAEIESAESTGSDQQLRIEELNREKQNYDQKTIN